jgi:hypothetical protein
MLTVLTLSKEKDSYGTEVSFLRKEALSLSDDEMPNSMQFEENMGINFIS